MSSEKFHNTSITIKGLLGLIEAKDIAIPEIKIAVEYDGYWFHQDKDKELRRKEKIE